MAWPERIVESFEAFVDELVDLLPSTSSGNQLYWFRGQGDQGWGLETSLKRCLPSVGLSIPHVREIEEESRRAFRSVAHLHVSPQLLAKVFTTPCWWSLMQHHGAPTRLLDWTVSPYVAAYFAVQQIGSKEAGAVWCFCSNILRERSQKIVGEPPDFDAKGAAEWYAAKLERHQNRNIVLPLEFPLASSERCAAQQGRFTMCFQPLIDHNCLIQQMLPKYVRKLIIPNHKKPEFLLRLREMNITGSALFPGVDGLGQSVRELVNLRAHYRLKTVPLVGALPASAP